MNFSNTEDFNDDVKLKKVLTIPFENTYNSAIGLLPEHKVLELEKSNFDEDDDRIVKPYEVIKKKEKPLHSVSHEGSIGKN